MESFRIKKRLDKNGNYKIPTNIEFLDTIDGLLLKYNLENNIGINDNKLISAIIVYASHKHHTFFNLYKLFVTFYMDERIYVSIDGVNPKLYIYDIKNFYLYNNFLYRTTSDDEKLLLKRKIKIEKILQRKKKALPL